MKKWIVRAVLCLGAAGCLTGCRPEEKAKTDGYEYLVGVSLTNVMEPWLSNLVNVISAKAAENKNVNLIFRDAAGNTNKQIQDIKSLMECGIDLLILSPDGSGALDSVMEEVFEEIPIVVAGVKPDTDAYTTVIQADDEGIGKMAGEYILKNLYEPGKNVVVIEGVENSPISNKRLKGFGEAVQDKIPGEAITYYYGDWLQERAELRMKDYLVGSKPLDIVFAFNDEMAYGAYQACQQLRVKDGADFIGVDGFEGETAGMNLVDRGILNATIQTPDFGALAYDTAMEILNGKRVERNITIVPKIIEKK